VRDLGEIVTEALEAGRARQQVFARNAHEIGQAVATLLEALTDRRQVHLLGEGRCRPLATYVADLMFEGDGGRGLPARLLDGGPGPDGLARAVEAHAREGDVLLLLALEVSTRVSRAVSRARELDARPIAVLTPEAAQALACQPNIVVDLEGPHAIEGFLAIAHALWDVVSDGLVRVRRGDDLDPEPPAQPEPGTVPSFGEREEAKKRPERRRSTRITVRDAFVRWRKDRFPAAGEYHEPHLLEDLSLTGLRFRGAAARDLTIGDEVYACIELPLQAAPVQLRAQVRRLVKLKEPGGVTYAAGVKVTEWIGEARQRVRDVVESDTLRAVRRR